jgi:hypothetical protein
MERADRPGPLEWLLKNYDDNGIKEHSTKNKF